jgi:hypothetical protein
MDTIVPPHPSPSLLFDKHPCTAVRSPSETDSSICHLIPLLLSGHHPFPIPCLAKANRQFLFQPRLLLLHKPHILLRWISWCPACQCIELKSGMYCIHVCLLLLLSLIITRVEFTVPWCPPPFEAELTLASCALFRLSFFCRPSIMSALSNYLAAGDSPPPPIGQDATAVSPLARFGRGPCSPLNHRARPSENIASSLAAASNRGNTGEESEESIIPLTPPPRRGPVYRTTFSGPTPAQRPRREPSESPSANRHARDSDPNLSAGSPLGRRVREADESDTDTFGFEMQGMLSPRTRRKRRGIAQSVSMTFGLPEQSIEKFSQVCYQHVRSLIY